MITKTDLKIEAARLAMESMCTAQERGEKIEFTQLAEEIYAFLQKDLDLKDVDDPENTISKLACSLATSWGNTSNQETKMDENGSKKNNQIEIRPN